MYRLDAIMFTLCTLKILHTCSFFILLKLNNIIVANNTCDSYYWNSALYVEYHNVYVLHDFGLYNLEISKMSKNLMIKCCLVPIL